MPKNMLDLEIDKKKNTVQQIKWKRNCPKCGGDIFYKYNQGFYRAVKENRMCLKCYYTSHPSPNRGKRLSEETKKISIATIGRKTWNKGKPLSDVHKQNLSKSLMGRKSWSKGKKFSKQYRIKLSKSHKGQKSPMEGKHHRDETKLKLREIRCEWIKNHYGGPQYNPKACDYLDLLNKEKGWELQHALNGGECSFLGYFVDGYDKDRNIIVEYDEPKHQYQKWKIKDLERQKKIINHLKCKFYRFDEKKNLLYECL